MAIFSKNKKDMEDDIISKAVQIINAKKARIRSLQAGQQFEAESDIHPAPSTKGVSVKDERPLVVPNKDLSVSESDHSDTEGKDATIDPVWGLLDPPSD